MLPTVEKGIGGGISHSVMQYTKTINKHMKNDNEYKMNQ